MKHFIEINLTILPDTEAVEECRNRKCYVSLERLETVHVVKEMKSKNGTRWFSMPTVAPSVSKFKGIRRGYGRPKEQINLKTPAEALKLFLTPDIVQEIVSETNREAEKKLETKHEKALKINPYAKKGVWKQFSETEFWAFLGLVITAGVQKSWDIPVRELFLDPRSDPIYRATFSVNRFEEIRRNMRFDDRSTRKERQGMGKLAPIKFVFDCFLKNCQTMYEPNSALTIDEQLLDYDGRTPMTQYMPAKPAKKGIKIFWICDAVNGFAINGKIYTGKVGSTVQKGLAANITKELSLPFHDTRRTVTLDNYFTTLDLVEFLKEQNIGVVGTVKSNRTELPDHFKERGKRELYSSLFAFRQKAMLVSYVAKPKKVVNIISSIHNTTAIEGPKDKPEMVPFYNRTKGGVDLMDRLVANYTCKRRTRRWPMALFYNIVDISALNACIVYHLINNVNSNHTDKRRLFLKELGMELAMPHMKTRLETNNRLPKAIVKDIGLFGIEKTQPIILPQVPEDEAKGESRARCYKCTNDRKVSNRCQKCHIPICRDHSRMFCEFCIKTLG